MKSISKILFLTISLLLLMCGSAWGADTWYAGPAGSGTDCTTGSPCDLDYTVNTKAQVGDTVLLKDGTYNHDNINETAGNCVLLIEADGTAESWITIKAENEHLAIIDCEDSEAYTYGFWLSGASFLRFEDIDFKSAGLESWLMHFGSGSTAATAAHDIYLKNCILRDVGLNITGTGKSQVLNSQTTAYNITVDGCLIHNSGNAAQTGPLYGLGIYAKGCWIIKNNVFHSQHSGGHFIKPSGYRADLIPEEARTPYTHLIVNNTFGDSTQLDAAKDGVIWAGTDHIWSPESKPVVYIHNNVGYGAPGDVFLAGGGPYDPPDEDQVLQYYHLISNITSATDLCQEGEEYLGTDTDNLYGGSKLALTDFELTDPTNDDYSITAASDELIDTGLATYAPEDDYLGTARPLGLADDIGAYEYDGPYYFSNDGDDNNTGLSDAEAWEDPNVKIDSVMYADGTDFYFKQGHTFNIVRDGGNQDLDLVIAGVDADNRTIFGCYEADGDFDCSGTKPILQVANDSVDVFTCGDNDYLRFQQLDIRNSSDDWEDCLPGYAGTSAGIGGSGEYYVITECNFYHLGHYSIVLTQASGHHIITWNTFDTIGNAIYIANEGYAASSSYNYIANNVATNIVGYDTCDDPATKSDGHLAGLQRVTMSIIEDNTVTDAYNGAIVLWDWGVGASTYTVIRRNKIYGSRQAGVSMNGGSGTDTFYGHMAYQNIVTLANDGSTRGALAVYNSDNTSIGVRYFNNTLYNNYTAGIYIRAWYDEFVDYVYFKNNLVGVNDLTASFVSVEEKTGGDVKDNLFADHNLYWTVAGDPSAAVKWEDTNVTTYNWADWKTRGNDGDPATLTDPSFVNAGNNDFTLNSNSSAINTGDYLSYVAAASSSGTTITVADSYWFHGDYGLVDEDGNAVTGMEITFYDTTTGLQHRTITSDTITHGTPGTFVVDSSVTWIYDVGNPTDPEYTTQIALTFYGSAPDIGANEWGSGSGYIIGPVTFVGTMR